MDPSVAWSEGAERDLDEAAGYIAGDSETYAAALVTEILLATHRRPDGRTSLDRAPGVQAA